ncbi:C-type lectin superfamily 4 member G [Sarotherodon galilaeus]
MESKLMPRFEGFCCHMVKASGLVVLERMDGEIDFFYRWFCIGHRGRRRVDDGRHCGRTLGWIMIVEFVEEFFPPLQALRS